MAIFSIKKMYVSIRGVFPKVSWRKLVCNNLGAPIWIFIMRLIAHGKLNTRDRLLKWGLSVLQNCPLCVTETENIVHLFFQCDLSAHIWNKFLQWQGINRVALDWHDELKWAEIYAKKCDLQPLSGLLFTGVSGTDTLNSNQTAHHPNSPFPCSSMAKTSKTVPQKEAASSSRPAGGEAAVKPYFEDCGPNAGTDSKTQAMGRGPDVAENILRAWLGLGKDVAMRPPSGDEEFLPSTSKQAKEKKIKGAPSSQGLEKKKSARKSRKSKGETVATP
ncbi:uncharacterized protein [Nicotiana tomentosiformis]|uniref:uncharacterized protein n=1 Tax=Nicotiana tomentosiformis TaxID=4098 RepID=UPI00388C8536